ncbi:MAG: 30S ribosomal protein S20 [Deltaproteobacteria bacterium]|nr:30S ribosomal protein S20 [Deltaproteobacteria bacterium]RLA90588.1 MAG: 30S ribosomal protein S20 [Deltaproteobacteria bacterium]
MATHKSALKRMRQNEKKRERNKRYRSMVKNAVKKVKMAIDEKDKEKANLLLRKAIRIINKVKSKGVIHPNNASRRISRLTKKVNSLQAS